MISRRAYPGGRPPLPCWRLGRSTRRLGRADARAEAPGAYNYPSPRCRAYVRPSRGSPRSGPARRARPGRAGKRRRVRDAVLLIGASLGGGTPAPARLGDATLIWAMNVVTFAVWYWKIDGGGPARRRRDRHASGDFLFPQIARGGDEARGWSPGFVDYLFLAFNISTACLQPDGHRDPEPAGEGANDDAVANLPGGRRRADRPRRQHASLHWRDRGLRSFEPRRGDAPASPAAAARRSGRSRSSRAHRGRSPRPRVSGSSCPDRRGRRRSRPLLALFPGPRSRLCARRSRGRRGARKAQRADYLFISYRIRRPFSVRSGSNSWISWQYGTTAPAGPPVAITHGSSAPISSRLRRMRASRAPA